MYTKTNLILPSVEFELSYRSLIEEFVSCGERLIPFPLTFAYDDFEALVTLLENQRQGIGLRPGFVANTTYLLIDEDAQVVGVSNLRHELTPELLHDGGSIGYGIRPSMRQKGLGTIILKKTLEKAKEMGLREVLITCAKSNIGSQGVILNNGGVFEEEGFISDRDEVRQKYWISL